MFTEKAKAKIKKIIGREKLVPTWRYGTGRWPVYLTEKQIQMVLKDGKKGCRKIEDAYRIQDASSTPEEHAAIFDEMKTRLLKDKLFSQLQAGDFSKSCFAFWNLLEETEGIDEVLEGLEFDIRHWVSENIGFNIDPNLDTLIGNHAESVEMAMDSLSWSTLQEIRVKKSPGDWLFVTLRDILKEHDEATIFTKEFNNLGGQNETLISTKSWARYSAQHITHTVPVALNLKEYLERYPEGIDAESHCVRFKLDSGEALHVELEKDIPFLATLAASEDTICHQLLSGVEEISVVEKGNCGVLVPAEDPFSETFEEVLKEAVFDFVEQKLEDGEYDHMDNSGRSLIHYIYISENPEMLSKLIMKIMENKDLYRMGDILYTSDKQGVSILTLCKAIDGEFSNYVMKTLYQSILSYLPDKNATATQWECEPRHLVSIRGERYFLIEGQPYFEQNANCMETEFLLLHQENRTFEQKKLRDIDGIYTIHDTRVYLDGEWSEDMPF